MRLATMLFAVLCGCGGSTKVSTGTDAAVLVDGSSADAVSPALSGDGGPGAICTFNRDCVADARCECSEAAGCACQTGVRGTGKNGVDACTDGNDCASALCVQGPGSVYYCSDECLSGASCTGMLPMCIDVAFIGKICARAAP